MDVSLNDPHTRLSNEWAQTQEFQAINRRSISRKVVVDRFDNQIDKNQEVAAVAHQFINWKDSETFYQTADAFTEGEKSLPPDPNLPVVDPEIDEEAIWFWNHDLLNQPIMRFD